NHGLLILYSQFSHFDWTNFLFFIPTQTVETAQHKDPQLVVVLHQALHADTYTGPLGFFGHQNRCGYSITHAKLGF
uniref:Uncharacterized protein n=1 Tax=Corvus moneduloides TaxID=1196302 RepID=A0A8C3H1V9_CORMO